MAPGKCLSGWVTFTVKEGSLATAVIYDGSRRLTWTVPPPKGAKPTTTTTLKAGAATAASSTTSTTSSKAKVSTTTTTAEEAKAASGSAGSTTSTTAGKSLEYDEYEPSSPTTTSRERPGELDPVRPHTTTGRTVVTTPTDQDG